MRSQTDVISIENPNPVLQDGYIRSSFPIWKKDTICRHCEYQKLIQVDSILWKEREVSDTLINESKHKTRTSVIQPEGYHKSITEKPHLPEQNAYLSIYIILGIFAAGSVSYMNRKSFSLLLKSTTSSLSIEEILRDRKHITGIFFTAPFLLSTLFYSLFISHALRFRQLISFQYVIDVILIAGIIIFFHILKNMLLKALGDVFGVASDAEKHILFHHQFFCFSSWIFPVLLASSLFLPVNNIYFFHTIIIVSYSLSILYTTIRLFVNFSYNGLSSIALFILYICSVEVIPFLLLIKMLYLTNRF